MTKQNTPTQKLARQAGTNRGRTNRGINTEIRRAIQYGMKIGSDIQCQKAYDPGTQNEVADGYLRSMGLID